MIYTVTFNPAIDYVMHTGILMPGEVNRSSSEEIYYGGKGINVSVVLRSLGIHSTALGFIAGFVGDEIEKGLKKSGINTDFIRLEKGCSRINVKLKSDSETDINAQGPEITEKALNQLYEKLSCLNEGDMLVLAGSIPGSLPKDIYEKIMKSLSGKKIKFVVDATGDLLLNVLSYKPFLIKPNHIELGEIFGRTLCSDSEIAECAKILKERGAENVLVSMAASGSILLDENNRLHRLPAHPGKVINSVGAGDSMVAGFIAGYLRDGSFETAHKTASAAGSATAFSNGLAGEKEIQSLLEQ